jgi:hypothetical protein
VTVVNKEQLNFSFSTFFSFEIPFSFSRVEVVCRSLQTRKQHQNKRAKQTNQQTPRKTRKNKTN